MFYGTGTAMITPFTSDLSVDYPALAQLVETNIAGGVTFLVALGTTAETPTLTADEKQEIFDFIVTQAAGRVPVVVGIGGNDTRQVIRQIESFSLEKAAGILSVVPYYNKPGQEAIYRHFEAIAQSTDKPIILYNVPGRTAVNMTAATTLRLAEKFDNIVAIKEAGGDMAQCMELARRAPDDFAVLSGDDHLSLAQMALGFRGVISVAANSFPHTFSKMIRHACEHDLTTARRLHYEMLPGISLLFAEGNPAGVKALLTLKGACENHLRLPMIPASDALVAKLAAYTHIG